MKVFRTSEIPKVTASVGYAANLFTGGEVTRQNMLQADMVENNTCSIVNFPKGSKNKWHSHTSDQILIVTVGVGIIASETEQREIVVGDVAFIPRGEKHWHGGTKTSSMSHINVISKDSVTNQLED